VALMFFNVPQAREYLLKHGFVYTVRDHLIQGRKKAVYGSYREQVPIGDVQVKFIHSFRHTFLSHSPLGSFVQQSGFQTVEEWVKEIKPAAQLYLHEVRLLGPVKGEQPGMLGVPGKVHVQKRPYSIGQEELEDYSKYKRAMETPRQEIIEYDKKYTLEELKELCRKKGLPTSGDKKRLAEMLIAHYFRGGK